MTIHVCNIRAGTYDPANPRHVYCGRANRKLPHSPLHNPWRLAHESGRNVLIDWYRAHLERALSVARPDATEHAARREFERLTELAQSGDLWLYCWCAPKACHCDVIKAEIERRVAQ